MKSQVERDLGRIFGNPHRNDPQPPKSSLFAVFADGTEAEIARRVNPANKRKSFRVSLPNGETLDNDVLRDLQRFVEDDFPGVTFVRRPR